MNTSNLTYELYQYSTYNTGCIDDVNRALDFCTKFKVDVISSMSTRFKIGVIILVGFVILSYLMKYVFYHYENKNWYNFIVRRIDWILILLALTLIAMMFI